MGVDFDVQEFCRKLRLDRQPPYQCPIEKCDRTYKSTCGLTYHLQNFDHENPGTPIATPAITPRGRKGRVRPAVSTSDLLTPVPEALTFIEAQKMVQFEINGKPIRVNITDEIPVVSAEISDEIKDEIKTEEKMDTESNKDQMSGSSKGTPIPSKTKSHTKGKNKGKYKNKTPNPKNMINQINVVAPVQLPEPEFTELSDYNISDAPPRPNAYIRFIEKPAEELDGEVEYDVDEEDTAWLSIMNEKREAQGICPVPVDTLELLMDRLEKESYFQASATGHTNSGGVVDDDAVCCICMDGECQNTNVILFCDMCNLAVHQDCYGVPYIPEGQWLCRKCLQSPSRAVDCVLCPNHGGAFKQTDRGQWAHVVCALWIPEVRFANTVFLEPIDSIETIPAARWKLTCYVCKQRGVGACIQCHRGNCYAAFHVTCAQQAGLYMKMDTIRNEKANDNNQPPILVEKTAYCDTHTPSNLSANEDSHERMKQARKVLAKKRTSAPVILIPTIPPERVQEIGQLVHISKKSQFIQRLIAYWTLKRQFRNGVPLLRRLQSSAQSASNSRPYITHAVHSNPNNSGSDTAIQSPHAQVDIIELCRQLKYWQCLRQDLERARLLCELVRKRERTKFRLIKASEDLLMVQLKPYEASLRKLLDQIAACDDKEIFLEPVDLNEVPDYMTVVKEPMDVSTMRQKLDAGNYHSIDDLEKDFKLMISNCLAYNNKDTVFYKAGIKMREAGKVLINKARKEFKDNGLLNDLVLDLNSDDDKPLKEIESQLHQNASKKSKKNGLDAKKIVKDEIKEENSTLDNEESLNVTPMDIETEFNALCNSNEKDYMKTIKKFEQLLEKCQSLKHGLTRNKRTKLIRNEINRLKKQLKSEEELEKKDEEMIVDTEDDSNITIVNTTGDCNDLELLGGSYGPVVHKTPEKNLNNTQNKDNSNLLLTSLSATKHVSNSPTNSHVSCNSPSGVNRRTAVLFTRKARQAALKSSALSNIKTDKSENLNSINGSSTDVITDSKLSLNPFRNLSKSKDNDRVLTNSHKSGRRKKVGRPKRLSNQGGLLDGPGSAEKIPSQILSNSSIPESFRIYRGANANDSDDNDNDSTDDDDSANFGSSSCSSCCDSSVSCSDSFSETENSLASEDTPTFNNLTENRPGTSASTTSRNQKLEEARNIKYEPLQLVWAKCRGYPWYPALIIPEDMPKGYVHRGVPIPSPPPEVLAARERAKLSPQHQINSNITNKNNAGTSNNGSNKIDDDTPVYLILFFDAKRTWQWLPPEKLEPLGVDPEHDQAKVREPRKPTDRKAVRRAYQHALLHQCQVNEPPGPDAIM